MLLHRYAYYLSSIFTLLTGFRDPFKITRIFLGAKVTEGTTVQLRGSGLKFKVRGKMDVWSLKETLLDRFYERFGFAVQDGWTIVDIGGGIGDYTIFAAHNRDQARVMVFEPFPESYRLLQDNLTLNQIHNVQLSAQAVGSQTGMVQFGGGPADPLSRQTSVMSGVAIREDLAVQSVSLGAVLEQLASGHIDLIKLDCEGAEFDILMNSPATVLEKIDRIVLEYHDGVTSNTHLDLVKYLTEQGFQVENRENFAHANIGYLRAWKAGA
ncbi:MAG TPA: FkbM family methyltransferase [Bellilinea sp.]|nr:FkbM family methyltransferase [Bellilinea sp.]